MLNQTQLRRAYPAILAALGLLLFFPFLSSFGLWDPYEIRIADAARALDQHWTWGPQLGKPPLLVWAVTIGFKYLGVGELGGRVPIALLSLATLLATYYAGVRFVGRRGALFGAFALATTPAFLLGARQLTSDAPMLLGAVLAVGGLARAAWAEPEASLGSRVLDLALGVLGLVIGQFSCGLVVGVIAPIATVTVALALGGGSRLMILVGALATLVPAVEAAMLWRHPSGYSFLLGGVPHALGSSVVVTSHLKQLGFGLFPWIAVAPVAAMRFFSDADPDAATVRDGRTPARERFGAMLLVTWFVVGYLAGTVQAAGVADLHIPVGPALLLLVGGYLDELLDDPRPLPFAGLTVAVGALILGRDFFLFPEQYVAVHMMEQVRWPGPLTHLPYLVMAFAGFFGGVLGLGLGAPLVRGGAASDDERKRRDAAQVRGRRMLIAASGGAALLMMLVSEYWIIPQVSKHLSAREIYGKAHKLDPNAPVGQYRFNASGASYYGGGKTPTTLNTVADLFTFLANKERVFVMAGSDELPAIDQEARQRKQDYFVIDDSNSRYLVLTNRLGPNEKDLNPLRLFISDQPPKPTHPLEVNFDNKVALLGYDLPDILDRGQEFKIRLYFKVMAPLGGSYKVFLHFDGPGTRFNGDHVPLEGRFPTQNWVPGYYITDEHLMTPDRATQPSGYYRIFMGMFAGDQRLKVISGPQDGDQRVKLGQVTIR
ncbi:MAG TPA: glycosyltransferase family 39 protein [Polyangia bacterium]|nr:glycosyltransferase family 39 protein [Polyangia bacterium]